MLTPDDFGLSPNHYRIVDQTLIEKWPTICPNQHPLGRQKLPRRKPPVRRLHGIEPPHMETRPL